MRGSRIIEYSIKLADPGAHLLEAELRLGGTTPDGQLLSLPSWIRGSYLVRDFARGVVELSVEIDGRTERGRKIDKSTWRIEKGGKDIIIRYEVYANDLSVRGVHFDTTHAYFNGPSVFLKVHDRENEPYFIKIADNGKGWKVATSMPVVEVDDNGFGEYSAESYEDLIDHPVEIGRFSLGQFDVLDVPHKIAITGRHRADMDRVCRDVNIICEQHMQMFGEPAPIDRYLFLVTAVGDGYGGLEHRYSSSLICKRGDLPRQGVDKVTDDYRKFLGLCSHEYFHLWNVKRIRPAAFAASNLSEEAYTKMLWIFEGITSYYDDLALVRSGLITRASYLQLVARTITRVLRTPGRLRQTLEESSFDTWIKFYKRDENTPNVVISYYDKGSLAALALDLTIRSETDNAKSLDDVMRRLWRTYGDKGLPEGGFEELAEAETELSLTNFFDPVLRSTDELPLSELLEIVGVEFNRRPAANATDLGGALGRKDVTPGPWLGVKSAIKAGRAKLRHVYADSPAANAGLSASDEIVAIEGLRVTSKNFEAMLATYKPGDTVEIVAFRRDELMSFMTELAVPPKDTCDLWLVPEPAVDVLENRENWLHGSQSVRSQE